MGKCMRKSKASERLYFAGGPWLHRRDLTFPAGRCRICTKYGTCCIEPSVRPRTDDAPARLFKSIAQRCSACSREIMKTFSNIKMAGGVLALCLTFSATARDRGSLNGTWTLVPSRSDFAGQSVVQTGTVTIADRQGNITISRSFAYEGAAETVFYTDMSDSQRNATIRTGKDLKSKTRWDHDVLKVTTTQSGAITLESYTLASDGTMMVNVIRPDRKPITLVFQHQ